MRRQRNVQLLNLLFSYFLQVSQYLTEDASYVTVLLYGEHTASVCVLVQYVFKSLHAPLDAFQTHQMEHDPLC